MARAHMLGRVLFWGNRVAREAMCASSAGAVSLGVSDRLCGAGDRHAVRTRTSRICSASSTGQAVTVIDPEILKAVQRCTRPIWACPRNGRTLSGRSSSQPKPTRSARWRPAWTETALAPNWYAPDSQGPVSSRRRPSPPQVQLRQKTDRSRHVPPNLVVALQAGELFCSN